MMTESTIYWITRMTFLHGLALTTSITFTVLTLAWLGTSAICHFTNTVNLANGGRWNSKEFFPLSRKSLRWSIPCFLLSWILVFAAGLIPTTKETCAIKAIPVIVNNKRVQELPNKVVELANEWIDELKPSSRANRQGLKDSE